MRMTIKSSSFLGHHHYSTKATKPFNTGKKLPGHPFLPSTHFLAIFIQVNWILTCWKPLYLHCEVSSLSCFKIITFSFFKKITFPFFWSSNPLKFLPFWKPLFLQCALLFEDKEGWPGSPTFHSVFPVQGSKKSIARDSEKVFQTNQSILPSNYLANPHRERKFLRKVFFSAFPTTNLYHPLFDRMIATKNQSVKCWWSIV